MASIAGEDSPTVDVIGTRHGEKLHETLLSWEEVLRSSDEGDYFRVPLDARSLQYEKYVEEGEAKPTQLEAYNSANTTRLDVEGTKDLLRQLPEIQALMERAL